MSALFLRQLAQKTHRGLEGRIREEKSAGGISYGYRLDRQPLPDGTFTTGDRVIDVHQAAIVRRIFGEYNRGMSARAIAMGLNKDGVRAPRAGGKGSGTWSFSTISGNWRRGTGILNNELYVGRLVWNRQRFVKDPETGKRQARPNPPEKWVIEDVPHLRLIEDDVWDAVKHRQGAIREDILAGRAASPTTPSIERGHRPRYLLSGQLSCGCCGAGYIMISATRYGYSAARNRGTCSNRKSITRADVETRVLNGLQRKLMHPDLIREFVTTFQEEMRKNQVAAMASQAEHERRYAKVVREIDAMVTAIAEGMFHPSMKAKMDALEAERADLEAKLAATPKPEPVTLHPGLSDIYAKKVDDLATALNEPDTRPEAAELLRGLIDRIILTPDPDAPNGHSIALHSELGAILSLCDGKASASAGTYRSGGSLRQVTMVAGAVLELMHLGHPQG